MFLTTVACLLLTVHTNASQFGIYGTAASGLGKVMSSAGDINNDGIMDLIVCPQYVQDLVAYIIFGAATIEDGVQENLLKDVDLASFNSSQGFRIMGTQIGNSRGFFSCPSASALGDVNGDGIDDIILGQGFRGVYVVFGHSGPVSDIDLAFMPANSGVKFTANQLSQTGVGYTASAAGDVNGDGLNDMVVGAPYHYDRGVGPAVYVVYGSPTLASTDLLHMSNTTGYVIYGTDSYTGGGFALSSADVNGDGLSDIIVGETDMSFHGAAYVLFGSNSSLGDSVYLNSSFDGFRIDGVNYVSLPFTNEVS